MSSPPTESHIDKSSVVFWASAGFVLVFTIIGASSGDSMGGLAANILAFITSNFSWLFLWSMTLFLLFCSWLLVSKAGRLRLGPDDEPPDFNMLTWLCMLFSAGMGIGLLFYGVAEPMMHYTSPPTGQGGTPEAARQAMVITFFHWGINAWSVYAVVALALGYFGHRHGLPLTLRSSFGTLSGAAVGRLVDVLAVVGTLFGVATSLGLGAQQINAGLTHLFDVSKSSWVQLILIALITAVATISVVTGVEKGVRRLSELNIITAGLMLLFLVVAGPTGHVASAFVVNLGNYLAHLPAGLIFTDALGDEKWQGSWSTFYWAWWISWSPFVGMFIARVSRGRTVREVVAGVLFIPSLVTFIWFTVFGNTALYMDAVQGGAMAAAVEQSVPTALFILLERLPWSDLVCTVAVVCIASFFVTSSDSASMVIDIITSGGDPDPPVIRRIFWACSEGAVAATLLLTGGLKAFQSAVIATALPFTLVLLVATVALGRALRREARALK